MVQKVGDRIIGKYEAILLYLFVIFLGLSLLWIIIIFVKQENGEKF
jgi:uncharacterized membrane protein